MKNNIAEMIDQYKKELLAMSRKTAVGNSSEFSPNSNDIFLETLGNENAINSIINTVDGQAEEYLNFMQENPKLGSLRIQANTARQTIPVANALVEISKNFKGIRRIFYSLRTDASGIIDEVWLPAPDKALSQEPSNRKPFANYDVHVEHPGYNDRDYSGVLIFDGIKSIQQVDLIPIT